MKIKELWKEFNKLSKTEQIVILKEYANYAGSFGKLQGAPVCFLEWWVNDYLEGSGMTFKT